MIEELVERTFATRNATHLAHWKTKSFSEHQALGDFYDAIIDGIDHIVEAYQGISGLISVKSLDKQTMPGNIIKHLEDDLVWISDNRKKITCNVPAIDNLLQELEMSYMKTLYKLKNLA